MSQEWDLNIELLEDDFIHPSRQPAFPGVIKDSLGKEIILLFLV